MKRVISCILVSVFLIVGMAGCSFYDPYGGLITPKLFAETDKTGQFWLRCGGHENNMVVSGYLAMKDYKAYMEFTAGNEAMRMIMDGEIPAFYILSDARKIVLKYEKEQEKNFLDAFMNVSRKKQDWVCGNETLNGYLYYYEETISPSTNEKIRFYYTDMGSDAELKYLASDSIIIEVYEYGTDGVDDSIFELPEDYRIIEQKY